MTAACGENAAAIGSRHALTESVFVDAFAYRGLECPFHYLDFLYFRKNGIAKVVFLPKKAKYFYTLLTFAWISTTNFPSNQGSSSQFFTAQVEIVPGCRRNRFANRAVSVATSPPRR